MQSRRTAGYDCAACYRGVSERAWETRGREGSAQHAMPLVVVV